MIILFGQHSVILIFWFNQIARVRPRARRLDRVYSSGHALIIKNKIVQNLNNKGSSFTSLWFYTSLHVFLNFLSFLELWRIINSFMTSPHEKLYFCLLTVLSSCWANSFKRGRVWKIIGFYSWDISDASRFTFNYNIFITAGGTITQNGIDYFNGVILHRMCNFKIKLCNIKTGNV